MTLNSNNFKTFHILTYGCQMNEYDSDFIKTSLIKNKYSYTEDENVADILLINTCNIREKAVDRMYSKIGSIKKKRHNKDQIIGITGCIAQSEGEHIFKRSSLVDFVVGPEEYHKMSDIILKSINEKVKESEDVEYRKEKFASIEFEPNKKFDFLPSEFYDKSTTGISSYVTIQEGCDKFCAFCVVPYTRGAEFSRKVEQVLDEVKFRVESGAKEICLLGQNVNAYHGLDGKGKEWSFAQLISKICEIKGLERVRYSTAHPREMTSDLISLYGYEKKLTSLVGLPVQSGSNRVLKSMNRKYTKEGYLKIYQDIKKIRPEAEFSSDFIVGFPEETEDDFYETIDLIKKVGFRCQSYSFKYSIRHGTPAAERNQVDEIEKVRRLDILQSFLDKNKEDFYKESVGTTVDVLFDNKNSKNENQISGRDEYLRIVLVDENELNNIDIKTGAIKVKIVQAYKNSLTGKLV